MTLNKEQVLAVSLSLAVLLSSWVFMNDIYACSNLLLVVGFYLVVLLLRSQSELFVCRNYLVGYQAVFLLLFVYLLCSIVNESHEYRGDSNSFVLSESKVDWLPSSSASYATVRSLPYMLFLIGVVGPTIFCLMSEKLFQKLLWVLLVNSLVLAIMGIIVKYSGSSKMLGVVDPPHGTERYFFSTFTYKNHWGCYMVLSLGIVATLYERYRYLMMHKYNAFFLVCLSIFAFAVILSGSRSCSLLYLLLFCFFVFRVSQFYFLKSRLNLFISVCIAALFVGLVAFLALNSDLANFEEMRNTTSIYFYEIFKSGQSTRYFLSLGTWDMFLASPVFGWGLGSFEFVYNFYNSGEFRGQNLKEDMHFIYAHNDIFQYFAEMGIIGSILLLLVFCIPLLYKVYNRITTCNWLLLVCFILLIYSFVEFPFRTPSVALLFTILFAAACRVQFKPLGD